MSWVIPSARAVRSALAPLYLNGSTATQNPSSARTAPETGAETSEDSRAGIPVLFSRGASSPALRNPSIRGPTSCGSNHLPSSSPADWAKSSFWASRSRRALRAAASSPSWPYAAASNMFVQKTSGALIGRGDVDGTPGSNKRPFERTRPDVEAVGVLVGADPREHRPAVRVGRCAIDGPLQRLARLRMLDRGQALVIPEAAHERLIGAELAGLPTPDGVADAPREHAEAIGASGDDAGDQVVLQLKSCFGIEGAVVDLRPKMGAGSRVHELHREAPLRPRLPQASLHHIAGAQLFAGRTDIRGLVDEMRGGTPGDDPKVRESRKAGHDVFS